MLFSCNDVINHDSKPNSETTQGMSPDLMACFHTTDKVQDVLTPDLSWNSVAVYMISLHDAC